MTSVLHILAMLGISVGAGSVLTGSLELKCTPRPDGDPDMPEIVTIVDGEVKWDTSLADLENLEIDYTEIICWSVVEKYFDVEVRQGAVLVLTTSFSRNLIEPYLASLAAGQRAHLGTHGVYSDDLAALRLDPVPPMTDVWLRTTADGWAARSQTVFSSEVCYVFAGTPPQDWTAHGRGAVFESRAKEPFCVRSATAGPLSG